MKNIREKLASIGGVLLTLGIITFVVLAIYKTNIGEGFDTFIFGGAKFNYFGVVVLFVAIPISILIALGLRWWHKREERDFIKKYSNEDNENT